MSTRTLTTLALVTTLTAACIEPVDSPIAAPLDEVAATAAVDDDASALAEALLTDPELAGEVAAALAEDDHIAAGDALARHARTTLGPEAAATLGGFTVEASSCGEAIRNLSSATNSLTTALTYLSFGTPAYAYADRARRDAALAGAIMLLGNTATASVTSARTRAGQALDAADAACTRSPGSRVCSAELPLLIAWWKLVFTSGAEC